MNRAMTRWVLLLVALGTATWLALFGDKTPPGVVQPHAASSRAAAAVAQAVSGRPAAAGRAPALPALETLADRAAWANVDAGKSVDLFAPARWVAAPPPAAAPLPVAAEAPALPPPQPPWRVVGKQWADEQWQVFLLRDSQSLVVQQGQLLEGTWRVDRIEPPMMTLTHVPSGQQHQLSIGEPS
jgi:hypothetical protein